jgi:dynein light chain LC8-type
MSSRSRRIFAEDVTDELLEKAFNIAEQAFDQVFEKGDLYGSIAQYIRAEFDKSEGPSWNCIVGRHFGAFVTHRTKTYMYFSVVPGVSVLIWRT